MHMSHSDVAQQMRPALVKYFRRKCGDSIQAEDLTHDVLLRTLGRLEGKAPEVAKGYIFRAAVNRWRDHLRHATLEIASNAGAPVEAAWHNEELHPERVLIARQELHRVTRALWQLSERTRDIFVLIRLENMRQQQIADMLGVSLSTVEKEYCKALAHLARHARDCEP